MSNTTTTQFWPGELYTRTWTDRMLGRLREARREYDFKIIGGGAGAWQWLREPDEARRQGLDMVFSGYFETAGPQLFNDILEGKTVPDTVTESGNAVEHIQPIRRPSVMGVIELSRGCGKGCSFCTMASMKTGHVPPDTILADLEANIAGDIRSVVSGSEDFFRYGGAGNRPNFDALHELLTEMRRLEDLSFMQIDHANITSVLQLSPEQLRRLRELLTYRRHSEYLWVNMGLESANGRLVQAASPGKIKPFDPDDWEQMALDAADRMTRSGFYPIFSVILGLPGETPDDVARTQKLVERLAHIGSAVFPIFHEPVRDGSEAFGLPRMRTDHLDLYTTCYEINFKTIPKLYYDNQRAGGVSWLKRTLTQLLGKAEILSWRRNFAATRRRLTKPDDLKMKVDAVPATTNER